ncbi:DUF4783 domain-containing protein [Fulvivirgaceae bacterium BMA10]|uniref:DUF4783 domain-containing protein n=1 Tax=Splendidivirga corallicola TaxID=3051826 RepID=A0ABT8KMQ7_9BACT|nr:DUF4783 domain-containing protein [Fulvivirgaceae bacterium BMA10]
MIKVKLVGLAFMFSLLCFAQNDVNTKEQGDVLNEVRAAIKTGSSKELVKHLNSRIDLVINGDQSSYSKTQAEFVLKDFFKKYPPSDFQYIHKGASKDGLKYAIGKYSHKAGTFRVVLRSKKFNSQYLIYNLDFTKE